MKKSTTLYFKKLAAGALLTGALFFAGSTGVFAAPEAGDTATVTAEGNINIRGESNTDSAVVGTAHTGDSFTISEVTEAGGKTWYKVSNTDGSLTGYIRSDFVEVSETEEAPEAAEGAAAPEGAEGAVEGEGAEATAAEGGSSVMQGTINPMEPEAEPDLIPAGFKKVTLNTGAGSVTGWANGNFYLLYAQSPAGETGWFILDGTDRNNMTWIRYSSSIFAGSAEAESKSSTPGVAFIALAVICGILLVLCIFFGLKLSGKGAGFGSYDDDDDDEEDDDDDEDDYEDDEEEEEQRPAVRRNVRPSGRSARPSEPAARPARASSGARRPEERRESRSSEGVRVASSASGRSSRSVQPASTSARVRRADPSRKSLATAQRPSNVPDDDDTEDLPVNDVRKEVSDETRTAIPVRRVSSERSSSASSTGRVQVRRSAQGRSESRRSSGQTVQRRTSSRPAREIEDFDDDDE